VLLGTQCFHDELEKLLSTVKELVGELRFGDMSQYEMSQDN
jgi:hypothetical protein